MKLKWNNLSLIPKRLVAPVTAILLWWLSLAQASYVMPDSHLEQTRRAININATSHHVQVAKNRFTTPAENYTDTTEAPKSNSALRKILLRRRISDTTDDHVYSQQVSRSSSWQWSVLHLIVQAGNFFQSPSGTGTNPGDTVVGNNNIFNARNQVTGYAQLSCIRSTNFVCTWTIFSASIATSGCDIYIQGFVVHCYPNTWPSHTIIKLFYRLTILCRFACFSFLFLLLQNLHSCQSKGMQYTCPSDGSNRWRHRSVSRNNGRSAIFDSWCASSAPDPLGLCSFLQNTVK